MTLMTLSQQPADSDIRVRLHGGRTPLHKPRNNAPACLVEKVKSLCRSRVIALV